MRNTLLTTINCISYLPEQPKLHIRSQQYELLPIIFRCGSNSFLIPYIILSHTPLYYLYSHSRPQRWEFIKEKKKVRKRENKKTRKQENKKTRTRPRKRSRKHEKKKENKNSTKKVIKKKRKNFLITFLVEFFFSFLFLVFLLSCFLLKIPTSNVR